MTKSTKSALVALAVPLLFSVIVSVTAHGDWGVEVLLVAVVALPVVVTIIAHQLWVVAGTVSIWTLPLGAAFCLLPTYVFSYHVIPGGFLGNDFTFFIYAVYGVLPSVVVATVLAVIQAVRGARARKRGG